MNELDIDKFTQIVVELIEKINENITLENPDDKEIFPCGVVSNPMKSISKVDGNIPVYTRFSINIEWWTNSKYTSMELYEKTNKLLREYNFLQIGTPLDRYDIITKKHRYGGRYEVNYNGITNSFNRVM